METNLVQNTKALKSLPDLWSVRDFPDVIKDASGGNKKTLKSDFLDEGDFAIVDQGQNLIAGYTNNQDLLVKSSPPYVIFGDHTRIFKYIDIPFAMGADGTKILKPKEDGTINEKYLYFFFLTLNIPNTGYNRHFKHLKNTKIPLPPMAEQKKIVEILDAADSLRQKDQQLIEYYTALSQSLFLDMFGDPVANPKGYEQRTLLELTNKITDGTHHTPTYTESGVPFLRVTDVTESNDSKKYISLEAHEELIKRCHPKKNDILYTKNGTIGVGKVIDWDFDFSIFVSLCLLKPKHNVIEVKYLNHFLNTPFAIRQAMRHSKEATIKNLHLVEIRKMKIPYPSKKEQKTFVSKLEEIECQKQQAQASLEKSEALFNSLLQRAFKGELTGKKAV